MHRDALKLGVGVLVAGVRRAVGESGSCAHLAKRDVVHPHPQNFADSRVADELVVGECLLASGLWL